MSAIVRGLRRSFRESDGMRPPGHSPQVAAQVRKRRQEREAAVKPTYRLFRGKKDVTDSLVPKAKTRRARFFDPEDSHGKKSLVLQAKSGALEAEVKSLRRQLSQTLDEENMGNAHESTWSSGRNNGSRRTGRTGRSGRDTQRPESSFTGRRELGRPRQSAGRRQYRAGGSRDLENYEGDDAFEKQFNKRLDAGSGRARPTFEEDRQQTGSRDFGRPSGQDPAQNSRRNLKSDYNQDSRQSYKRPDRVSGLDGQDTSRLSRRSESTKSPPVPLAISYTTAASQFLYGRSVVEAAIRSARRRLYKLYIYNGANSSSTSQDQQKGRLIEQLAMRRGIAVQQVDERWQRLLDKMSKGRPHNGYVLEASPLPLPPLTALGSLVTDGDDASAVASPLYLNKVSGFQVELGHQSREEIDVNGTSTFVPVDATTKSHHRPLVLLLDQVLDPGNLGAILRSACFLGVSAVAVSKHSSATLSSVALKASAGAAEAMALFSVETPATFLTQSRKAGWKVFTAVPPPEHTGSSTPNTQHRTRKQVLDLDGVEATDPLQKDAIILVMGSEGEGLPRMIRREADVEVSIANRSGLNVVDSLNVSVAAGLLCASFLKGSTRTVASSANEDKAEKTRGAADESDAEEIKSKECEQIPASNDLGIF
ncbi:hypothetical protein SEPCBS119000_002806 [Sporothrix epigloea]|uniref:rRNA methyltransferase 1, mitochondrial n=1 Tax=Sporothrix epigloea TaxID=1892477 RepID=A0ABP0DLR1_9PEZI